MSLHVSRTSPEVLATALDQDETLTVLTGGSTQARLDAVLSLLPSDASVVVFAVDGEEADTSACPAALKVERSSPVELFSISVAILLGEAQPDWFVYVGTLHDAYYEMLVKLVVHRNRVVLVPTRFDPDLFSEGMLFWSSEKSSTLLHLPGIGEGTTAVLEFDEVFSSHVGGISQEVSSTGAARTPQLLDQSPVLHRQMGTALAYVCFEAALGAVRAPLALALWRVTPGGVPECISLVEGLGPLEPGIVETMAALHPTFQGSLVELVEAARLVSR